LYPKILLTQLFIYPSNNRKLLQGCKAIRFRRRKAGAYTRAPGLSGLHSPRNSQGQDYLVQDNQDNAISQIQKQKQTVYTQRHLRLVLKKEEE